MSFQERMVSVFRNVPYPGDDDIALHDCSECRQIRDDFRGKTSQFLSDAILERRFDSLPLLSPAAFHYYVPAYMLHSLSHPDSEVASFTFMALGTAGVDALDLERFRLFSREQRDVAVAFLESFKSHEIEGDDRDNQISEQI